MKAIRLISFFLMLPFFGFPQNLIPNPSFEEHDSSYYCVTNPCGDNLECATHWLNPTTFDTPDYFHSSHPSSCSSGGSSFGQHVNVPNNWLGYQHPRTGAGYVGIHTFKDDLDMDAHEYLKAKLTQTLYIGQTYTFTMYVSKADDTELSTNGLGVFFTTNNYCDWSVGCKNIYRTPHFHIDEIISNDEDWLEYSWTFTAEFPYNYIFIGRFLRNDDSLFLISENPNNTNSKASYYIDDLSLIAQEVPVIDLGEDILTCEEYLLESPVEAERYLWSTGSDKSSINITKSGEYWLEVKRFGEIRRDTIQVDIINESKIYPNPSSGYVNLELVSDSDIVIPWKVYDISGRLIATGKAQVVVGDHSYPTDFSKLSSGIYLIQYINSCGEEVLEKMVVTR